MQKFQYLFFCLLIVISNSVSAQYKEFKLSADGDTLNAIDKKGLKQGKWVVTFPELRGNPGYDEEGMYKNDKKEGVWRKYTAEGDLLAMENFKYGGKDGIQQYYSFLGSLEREEEWHSYNPDAPYDTIPVYGTGSNEIIEYKIVKASQYSVPHGQWKYFDNSGRVSKVDRYERGRLMLDTEKKEEVAATEGAVKEKPKEKAKPQEVLEYEKKYSKKKREHMERTGATGL
ncbi:MAG: hypothetical protein V4556_01090 [Bacteroidota bacterium]